MIFSNSILYTIAAALYSTSSVAAGQASAVQYQNIGFSGSYQDVTLMDENSCACSSSQKFFSGTMSPLDEELSVHFRGPIKLAQFGVYYPSNGNLKKRDEAEDCSTTKHLHHKHKRAPVVEYAYVTETVFADADGNLINPTGATDDSTLETSVINVPQTTVKVIGDTSSTATFGDNNNENEDSSSSSSSSSSSTTSSSDAATTSSASSNGSGWSRSSYYSPGSAQNCVFMNNQGGTAGSGTWSSCFGNSISFASSDGVSGASSPQALGDVLFKSDEEFIIFSGAQCPASSASGTCGYYRDDIPAYQGFAGADKMFVFEFQMPSATDSVSNNHDMPAIWLLNAKIPRTLQYGDASCSCWSTGCGELDLFEVITSGSNQLVNHLHDGQGTNSQTAQGGGGTSDYLLRPYDSTMKAAVIFQNGNINIVTLDDNTSFDSSLSSDTVDSWLSQPAAVAQLI